MEIEIGNALKCKKDLLYSSDGRICYKDEYYVIHNIYNRGGVEVIDICVTYEEPNKGYGPMGVSTTYSVCYEKGYAYIWDHFESKQDRRQKRIKQIV